MSKEYVARRLAEIAKEPQKKIVKSKNGRTKVVTIQPEEFDMICYGDDRYEDAVRKFLDWEDTMNKSWLYMAHEEGRDPVKIGYTTDPKHRLANLNTSYPGELEWLLLLPFPETSAYIAEQKIHALLKPYKLKREWFSKKGLREQIGAIVEIILKTNPHARVREYYDAFGTPIDFSYEDDKEQWFWTVDVGQWEDESDFA